MPRLGAQRRGALPLEQRRTTRRTATRAWRFRWRFLTTCRLLRRSAGRFRGRRCRLARWLPRGWRASELLFLGDAIDAQKAVEFGLASETVEDAALHDRAQELARRLASGPTLAYTSTKMLLTRELDMGLGPSIELEAFTQALLMKTADHAEFYAAFTEGRQPKWTGR